MTRLLCRLCESKLDTIFVDLGLSPISNAFVPAENAASAEKFYPLKAYVCDNCHLVQLGQFERPETHFHAQYAYLSSFSETWLAHAREFVQRATDRFSLGPHSHVVEIGSNDGYLLQYFVKRGVPCLGVDPATNCAGIAWRERGVPTDISFFGKAAALRLRSEGHAADLMVANNVLAHVPDIGDFIEGFKILLKPEGTAVFEFPHLLELIQKNQFDTIYHEHYFYLSLLVVEQIFKRYGLRVIHVERVSTHGGSLRVYAGHQSAGSLVSPASTDIISEELGAGLEGRQAYAAFAERVGAWKRAFLGVLISIINSGKRVAAYGAPAKGNTLLNYCGIGTDFISFTVDRNTYKQGMLLPGTRIPIRAPDVLATERPDYVLILPWNLKDEIMEQVPIGRWGGRFVVPIPWPEIIE